MRFDDASKVEELIWQCRLADLPRSENRTILNRTYNGAPPFDEAKAEENNIEINRNDLEGVNMLAQARRQWNNAFLKPGNYFSVNLDHGPAHKRLEWSHIITREINRRLKRRAPMMEQLRAKGANTVLHGIGPVNWKDRRSPIPVPIPIGSLMIPSETDIDFENLPYFAIFREYTVSQLYEMTHGPRVDPGWNMDLVKGQLKYVGEQIQKQPNATAFQYMPERIEELIKQDLGFYGSDAVPTVDTWDFYFREHEDGKGWYRRVVLDWGSAETPSTPNRPESKNRVGNEYTFLYSSGKRRYADSLSEIIHCQFGDCSAVAPFKYHSVRSLGWMLWGVVDLQNRLHCKFNEAVFQSLLWFFRVASNEQLLRLKSANFAHMGVIPQGIEFVKAAERFLPDGNLVGMAFARNRQLMSENAASFTQDFDKGESGKEMTATETMARVNSVNAMVSGMLALAYTYEEFAYREIARRFCIKGNPNPDAASFRLACLKQGVDPDALDVDKWDITAERVLGGGNKTLEMAQVQFLQQMRGNLNPDAQRRIDHIAIESSTDDPALAEQLASLSDEKKISSSTIMAQLATERLLKGLPFTPPADAVIEDYVVAWLTDLAEVIKQAQQPMTPLNPEKLAGAFMLAESTRPLIEQMKQDNSVADKAKKYEDALKAFEQKLKQIGMQMQQQQKAQAGNGAGAGAADAASAAAKVKAEEAKTAAALKGKMMLDQAKATNMRESHAQRTAQRQVQFEMEQQREDRRTAAELRREEERKANENLNSLNE